jgi:ABC-type bacteriocin/lantibiotic exporter with double-glycine peptidase domain
MDNGLLFPYRSCGDKEGVQTGRLSIPNGHGVFFILGDAGAGKSTPDVIAEDEGKLRGNPI